MGQAPPVATAEAAPDEPAGSIRVTVVDAAGKALPDVTVTLGILATGGGGRSTKQARTDAQGQCRFTGLKTGSSHAYRPRVQHQGARYSAPPFQLPPDHGYRSRIRRLPITREREALLQFLGQSVLEFRDKQVSVQQRAELVNLAARTYVFPPKGLFVPLPAGFKAFQSERGMHDVRITHGDGGMRLFGSLPPGRIALGWAFELDYQAPDATFALAVPWPSYRYRVAVAARAGMQLDVAGFPAAQEAEAGGRQYWVTQIQRRPSDAPLDTLDITVRGIPGPGPWRWWALGGALLVLALGLGVASRRPRTPTQAGQEEAQTQLVTALVQLTQAHKAGDIGPQYYREQYERGRDALALLLAETAGDTATPSPRARANQPRKNATSS
ncbi:MAG: carboxypeptidase-like regulatory domain-containing protein [Polyangiales bacterium]